METDVLFAHPFFFPFCSIVGQRIRLMIVLGCGLYYFITINVSRGEDLWVTNGLYSITERVCDSSRVRVLLVRVSGEYGGLLISHQLMIQRSSVQYRSEGYGISVVRQLGPRSELLVVLLLQVMCRDMIFRLQGTCRPFLRYSSFIL